MRIGTIARRYAQALYNSALDAGETEEIGLELVHFMRVLEADREFMSMFTSPTMPTLQKRELVQRGFNEDMHPYLLNFLCLLFDKDREQALPQIAAAYLEMLLNQRGMTMVYLTTAEPLTPAQEEALAVPLRQRLGRDILFTRSVDPRLLAGAIIHAGDVTIDGSLRGRLTRLRRRLRAAGEELSKTEPDEEV